MKESAEMLRPKWSQRIDYYTTRRAQWLLVCVVAISVASVCLSFVSTAYTVEALTIKPKTKLTSPCRVSNKLLSMVVTNNNDFDFSSPLKWDEFYQRDGNELVEWHASISLTDLVERHVRSKASCLVIGCGNSDLPQVLHDHGQASVVTCLDTSMTCLEQLRQKHTDSPRMHYVCGDATQLHDVLQEESSQNHNVPGQYEVIVDKGLTDAILCGEGWNTPLTRLFEGASRVLCDGGVYLLISYRLPSSTQHFLKDIGSKVGLVWSFDLPENSNNRVSVSKATRTNITM